MSKWGAGLKQSDEFLDVYDDYFDRYLRGVDPLTLAHEIYKEYLEEFDADDITIMPDVCYALCLVLWECGASDEELWKRAESFFAKDVEFWRENSEPGLWKKREQALEKFRVKLSVPKEKPRKPKTGRICKPSLRKGDVFCYDSGGIKCGAAVLEVYDRECWRALIAVARKCRIQLENLPLNTDFNGRAGAFWNETDGFSCSNGGTNGYLELNCLYLERELRAFRKEHCLEECAVRDFFIPDAPVLSGKWT